MGTSTGRKQGLDKHQITRAAVELLDEVGLTGLSTRRLATKLGVRSPTLYWHVRDKDELLDLVADAICADAIHIDEALPWRDQLASGLRQFRALLLTHRDAAALLRQRPPVGQHRLGHIDTTVAVLLRAGFTEEEAAGISRLLATHVLASVEEYPSHRAPHDDRSHAGRPVFTSEQLEDHPHLQRVAPAYSRLSGDEIFDLGIEIVLDGLSHRARRA